MMFLLKCIKDVGQSLFADDGALWKRGRNINHITAKIQEAVNVVETLFMGFQIFS